MSVFSCRIVLAIAALASSGVAYAQTTFEAASIKLAPGGGAPVVRGGPGSSDPTLASFENIDLFSLVSMAYGVKRYQLLASEWLSMSRFEISARVPQGATVDQYRLMLQNLLAERFKLATHHDRREMQTYELVVAKSGSKLKESAIDPAATVNDGLQPPPFRAGPPPGYHGRFNMALTKESMEKFAAYLSGLLDEPVTDNTALTGHYDMRLQALVGSNPPAADGVDSPPSLLDAVQAQLGLRLTPKKDMVDILVVDHMEKTPTEN